MAAADEDADPAVAAAVREHVVDRRTQRSEAEAAGDDDDVGAFRRLHRPAGAEGPADPDGSARLEPGQRLADGADVADGVDEARPVGPVAADADGDFADAEEIEHVELARLEVRPRSRIADEVERDGVGELAPRGRDPVERRHERVRHRPGPPSQRFP